MQMRSPDTKLRSAAELDGALATVLPASRFWLPPGRWCGPGSGTSPR